MPIYGIKQIYWFQDGCNGKDCTEKLLEGYFFDSKEKAIKNCPSKDDLGYGSCKEYEVIEIEVL